jgi:hypothetical protein
MLRGDVGYKGDIISFEPIPELAQQLRGRGRDRAIVVRGRGGR